MQNDRVILHVCGKNILHSAFPSCYRGEKKIMNACGNPICVRIETDRFFQNRLSFSEKAACVVIPTFAGTLSVFFPWFCLVDASAEWLAIPCRSRDR